MGHSAVSLDPFLFPGTPGGGLALTVKVVPCCAALPFPGTPGSGLVLTVKVVPCCAALLFPDTPAGGPGFRVSWQPARGREALHGCKGVEGSCADVSDSSKLHTHCVHHTVMLVVHFSWMASSLQILQILFGAAFHGTLDPGLASGMRMHMPTHTLCAYIALHMPTHTLCARWAARCTILKWVPQHAKFCNLQAYSNALVSLACTCAQHR